MRASRRHRPLVRSIVVAPSDVDLSSLAERVSYIGSPEHKDAPSFAGWPRPRADATICDRRFVDQQQRINEWLRAAILAEAIGAPWEGDFPRYVWYRDGDTVYEARLVNCESGEYKGYALKREEWPKGIEDCYE